MSFGGIAETIRSMIAHVKWEFSDHDISMTMNADLPTFWNQFDVMRGGFKPTWIIIHHSFSPDGQLRDWDGIRKYHMSYRYNGNIISQGQYDNYKKAGKTFGLELPWRNVGYQFGIEEVDGKLQVMTGRKIGEVGAHAVGFNARSVGICCVGKFDLVAPSSDLMFMLSSLVRELQLQFSIARNNVIGHRETYARLSPPVPVQKSCPGLKFDMDHFRARLRA